MKQLSSLVLVGAAVGSLVASVGACSHSGQGAGDVDAGDEGGPFGGASYLDAIVPVGPDLSCLAQPIAPPPTTTSVDPMVLAGQVVEYTTAGMTPLDAAEVSLFRAGQPVVLARTHSASNGAFATGAVTTNHHTVHAYLKATKPGYRTAFFYPPSPFAANSTTLVVPTISDTEFSTVKTLLGAMQDDAHNGVLVVAVLDCAGQPITGATLGVRRGNTQVGHSYDLTSVIPAAAGGFVVFDVPDGTVHVSASYQGAQLPEHAVVVRATDPDCPTARGTLTSTIVAPGV